MSLQIRIEVEAGDTTYTIVRDGTDLSLRSMANQPGSDFFAQAAARLLDSAYREMSRVLANKEPTR